MSFKASIVAFKEDSSGYPQLSLPFTEVTLEQPNGEGACIPLLSSPDSRDKIVEGVQGSDTVIRRRKLGEIELQIDYVSADVKAEIEMLYYNNRSVYLNPNVGRDTLWSFPLMRSYEDMLGRKSLDFTRSAKGYEWDDEKKIMRVWDDDDPMHVFGAHWSRALRITNIEDNKCTAPYPTALLTGWAAGVGSPTIAFTDEIDSPVLDETGILTVEMAGGTTCNIIHGATGLTAADVVASFLLAWSGTIYVYLKDSSASVIDSYSGYNDGSWQLIKLGGSNGSGGTTATIEVWFSDSTTLNQVAMVGSTFIGNAPNTTGYPQIPDFGEASGDSCSLVDDDAIDSVLTNFTISFMTLYKSTVSGFFQIGTPTTDALRMTRSSADTINVHNPGAATPAAFNSVETEFGIVDGDWIHVVVRGDNDGMHLFINGIAHSQNGTDPWEPVIFNDYLLIGSVGGQSLTDGAISHLRLDRRAWTDSEIDDHYKTYFKPAGRAAIEPMFGKECIIESMEWDINFKSGQEQCVGSVVLKEIAADEDIAVMIPQEN